LKAFFIFIVLILTSHLRAQHKDSVPELVLVNPYILPEFPGGHVAMMNYLNEHITGKLIIAETNLKILKTVFASFVVDETGKVTQPLILRTSNSPIVDSLFIKALRAMPHWSIPTTYGKPAPQKLNLPYTVLYR
jgi:protein TonB